MTKSKRTTAWMLSMALLTVSVFGRGEAAVSAAGADVKLARKSVSLTIQKSESGTKYGTAKVKIKKGKGVKIKKVSCKVKKKSIASVSVKGKGAPTLTVKAKKKGNTKVTVSVRYKKAAKTKTKKLTLNVKAAVKEIKKEDEKSETAQSGIPQTPSTPPAATEEPSKSPAASTPPAVTEEPSESPAASTPPAVTEEPSESPAASMPPAATEEPVLDWEQLITDGRVSVQDNTIISCDKNISGSLKIPDGVTAIGADAFKDCSGLTSITIPESVTSIGAAAFQDCSGLTSITIPESVTTIGDYAFMYCSGLTSITIPKSVTSIRMDAFRSCRSLTSIQVAGDNSKYDSRNDCNAIIETETNTLLQGCKNTNIPDGVKCIGGSAFSGCSGLTSIAIPESVTSIGSSAFLNCSGLTSIAISESVTSIESGAFRGCSGLTSIQVADDNSKYDSRNNCNAIIETETNTLLFGCNNTNIPDSVTSIRNHAFMDCSGLTSIMIPESVTSIESGAFRGCSGLTSIQVADDNSKYDSRNDCNAIIEKETNTLLLGCKNTNIPDDVTSIGANAFFDCSGLTSITIPGGGDEHRI